MIKSDLTTINPPFDLDQLYKKMSEIQTRQLFGAYPISQHQGIIKMPTQYTNKVESTEYPKNAAHRGSYLYKDNRTSELFQIVYHEGLQLVDCRSGITVVKDFDYEDIPDVMKKHNLKAFAAGTKVTIVVNHY